jgi:hypothetical protein
MKMSDAKNLQCWSEINMSSCFDSSFSGLPLGMTLTLAEGILETGHMPKHASQS